MRGSFVAGCSTLPHPQQSQQSCYADFHCPVGCLEASSLSNNSPCRLWVAEIPVPSLRCRQRRSMAPSRTRSTRVPSLWAATFETICSSKCQQRLPIEVRGVKYPLGSPRLTLCLSRRDLLGHKIQSTCHYRRVWRPLYTYWASQSSLC